MNFYRSVVRPIVFSLTKNDAEIAHHWGLYFLQKVGDMGIDQSRCLGDNRLEQTFHNLRFPNPIGLAAGFSKNGEALAGIAAYGFGSIEIGTVPNTPQPGNPRPRLFRLPQEGSLINRMGFNSEGAGAVSQRLETLFERWLPTMPIGINLGKSKVVDENDVDAVIRDYVRALRRLSCFADYLVVNVSSPNTPGLRTFQTARKLRPLLNAVREESICLAETQDRPAPILLAKLSFDMERGELEEAVGVASECAQGMIGFNTTTSRDGVTDPRRDENGGLSGKLLAERSLELHRHLASYLPDSFLRVAVGGVDPTNVVDFLKYAHLVQLFTSWIYWGPSVVKDCNNAVLDYMSRENLKSLWELRTRKDKE